VVLSTRSTRRGLRNTLLNCGEIRQGRGIMLFDFRGPAPSRGYGPRGSSAIGWVKELLAFLSFVISALVVSGSVALLLFAL
jgi:hypothetical protein